MSANMMTAYAPNQTTEKQKAILSSMVMQNVVWPMELSVLKMQTQITAALEGKKAKPLDEKELALMAAHREMQAMEMQQKWLAALAVLMIYMNYEKGEDQDGQQRIDGV